MRSDYREGMDFRRFWLAETVSGFGTYITTIALQVLVVITLGGTALDVGLLNAARWLPYLLLGLVVGALVDRRRRKPILVGTDLGRGILLGAIPLLWLFQVLTLPVLLVVVGGIGLLTLLNDSASQSFLPRLVPRTGLLQANARLDQSAAVAQTSGPLVAGGLVALFGAPVAVLVDAVSYFFSAIVMAGIRVVEPAPSTERLHLRRDIAEGLRWVYRHPTLTPTAITTHVWFLFNSMLTTAFVPFVLLSLNLSAFELSISLAAAGVAGLLGAFLSTRVGTRWGVGPVVIAGYVVMVFGWAIIALVPNGVFTVTLLALGQGLYGFALGLQNANEMAFRQSITPDALQGRTNTTIRSINRAAIVIGAPLGGLLADAIGYRPTIWIGIAGFVSVAIALALSPFRRVRL
ncbi:MAG: MFS transporter [Salinibacterium sp.]|nr:MFS transporter [Salinibacterium sp.]